MSTTSPSQIYEFGPFRLDGVKRLLSRDGDALHLRPKAFDLLLILVRHRGQPVSKNELLDQLWPDTEVGEHNLTVTIAALRKLLGEKSGENRYIATLPGRGYTFVAELSSSGRSEAEGSTSSTTNKPPPPPRWPKKRWVALCAIVILAAASIATEVVGRRQGDVLRTSMLTSTGAISLVAISPNGRQIALVSGTPDEQAILLSDVAQYSPKPLLPPASVRYTSLAFSPDGQSLSFVAKKETDRASSLYILRTAAGGVGATRLKENVESAAIAGDGNQVAFEREDLSRGESLLVLSSLDSQTERILAVRKLPGRLEHPAWSPDGKRIACFEVSVRNGVRSASVIELGLDGSNKTIADAPFHRASGLTWTRNNGRLLASARDHKSGAMRLWSISPQSGTVRPLTDQLTSMVGVATDTTGRTAVTIQQRLIVALWIVPAGKGGGEARRVLYNDVFAGRAAWMPGGGDLLLESESTGGGALGVLDMRRQSVRPFLPGTPRGWMPVVCANGEDVYYRSASSTGNGDAIWRSDIRGTKRVEITSPLHWATLSCAQDNAYYAETTGTADRIGIWKQPRNGGPPVRLTTHSAFWPQLSPDGKWLACFYSDSEKPNDRRPESLAILPAAGGEPVLKFPLPASAEEIPGLAWNAESSGLYYVQNRKGAGGIWFQPVGGAREPSLVVDFPGEQIMHFAWSPDWKQLVVSRGVLGRDAVLLEGLSN
jgi:DNA-binding winged helix-turn-helix (wHTH) protein/Tol biopolymer transport system component